MKIIKIKNYIITESIENILNRLHNIVYLKTGKLQDIKVETDEIVVTCPNDEHASGREAVPDCHINLKDDSKIPYGWFHCFACNASGSFVKFVALVFSTSEEYAATWLIENYGTKTFNIQSLGDDLTLDSKEIKKIIDKTTLDKYLDWCPYLESRHLTRELCNEFGIKFDPITRQIIIPCKDKTGNIIMLLKRSIDKKMFYIDKSVQRPLFGVDKIYLNTTDKVIITEGAFDALSANQYGFPAIATLGSLSKTQLEQINNLPVSKIYLMFDNDAGGRAFNAMAHKLLSKRFLVIDVKIPDGYKDINELDYELFWQTIKNSEKNSYI